MNRHFFQESDEGEQDKCTEVELIKRYLKQNLQSKKQLSMFLDIHSHSNKKSIFAFAPQPTDMHDIVRTRRFSMLLDDVSELFSMKSCSYNNSKVKKNCARLGMYKAFQLADSYTIEASCYGYEEKNAPRSKYIETSSIKQFTIAHLLKFGETLAITASKHLGVYLNEYEDMIGGINIELDYGLGDTHKPKKIVLNQSS